MLSIKNILVPTDFSEGSMHAIRYAREFAQKFDATLCLFHVLEMPPGLAPGAMIHPDPDGRVLTLQEYLEELSTDKFIQLQSYLEENGVQSNYRVAEGAPHEAIVKAAEHDDVDMIVMGTHGRTGLKHFFMGSTAERVVRYAPCPVTVVRIDEDDKLTEEQLLLLVEAEA